MISYGANLVFSIVACQSSQSVSQSSLDGCEFPGRVLAGIVCCVCLFF